MNPKNFHLTIAILLAGIIGYGTSVFAESIPLEKHQQQWWDFQIEGQTGPSWTTETNQEDLCGHKLKISEDDFGNFVHFLTNLKAGSIVFIHKIQPQVSSSTEKNATSKKSDERKYVVNIIQCQVWSKHKDKETGNESFGLQQGIAHDVLIQKLTDYKSVTNINFLAGSSGSNAELQFKVSNVLESEQQYDVRIILQPK